MSGIVGVMRADKWSKKLSEQAGVRLFYEEA